jgi:hypothetical protein
MKKRRIIIFLMLPLLVFVAFVVYFLVSVVTENNKEYYFPQIKAYLKVYKPPFKEYGYVIIGKDSILSFSNNVDFIKVKKSETSWVSFIFNPQENNKIFIVDESDNIININQVDFQIEKINRKDTTFFEKHIVAGVDAYVLKPQYLNISIEGYLQSVFFTNYLDEYPTKAEPIKK